MLQDDIQGYRDTVLERTARCRSLFMQRESEYARTTAELAAKLSSGRPVEVCELALMNIREGKAALGASIENQLSLWAGRALFGVMGDIFHDKSVPFVGQLVLLAVADTHLFIADLGLIPLTGSKEKGFSIPSKLFDAILAITIDNIEKPKYLPINEIKTSYSRENDSETLTISGSEKAFKFEYSTNIFELPNVNNFKLSINRLFKVFCAINSLPSNTTISEEWQRVVLGDITGLDSLAAKITDQKYRDEFGNLEDDNKDLVVIRILESSVSEKVLLIKALVSDLLVGPAAKKVKQNTIARNISTAILVVSGIIISGRILENVLFPGLGDRHQAASNIPVLFAGLGVFAGALTFLIAWFELKSSLGQKGWYEVVIKQVQ